MLGRLLGLALGDRVPEDSVADYLAACRATGQKPFLDSPHFELPWAEYPGMIDWIKTVQGIAAIVAVVFTIAWWNLGLPPSCSRPSWHRFTAGSRLLEQFDRYTRLLVLDQTLVERQSALVALDAAFVASGGEGPPAAVRSAECGVRRPVVIVS